MNLGTRAELLTKGSWGIDHGIKWLVQLHPFPVPDPFSILIIPAGVNRESNFLKRLHSCLFIYWYCTRLGFRKNLQANHVVGVRSPCFPVNMILEALNQSIDLWFTQRFH